jgi:long-chain acyl-CoA synthetase
MIFPTRLTDQQVAEILTALPEKTSDVVTRWEEHSPDRPALVEASGAWTYRQLSSAIATTQAWLLKMGVRAGDRVMIVCENSRALVAVVLAAARLDAWPVLVNSRLSAREVDEIRDHCGARRVIYTTSVSPQATAHAKRHGAVIAEAADLGVIGLGSLNEGVEPESLDPVPAKRVAALIYTSGTTGQPKGVMLTHQGLLFMADVSSKIRSLTPDDRLYGVLPMSHAVGFATVLLGSLLSGATLYLAPRFDPVAALKALEAEKLTLVLGAPAMFALLVEYANLKGLKSLRFPQLRIISSSGAPLQQALKASVESLFGMVLYNGYGVTECSPTISTVRVEEPRSDTSVGRVLPGVRIRLVDTNKQSVPDGEVGELWVSGPTIMKGYYRSPEETAAAIDSEGWFNTRDLARVEGENLFIAGRTKELIVRFGFNVYPAEVEAALNTHPAVVRSAVIGQTVQGTQGGEEVIAFVQPAPNSSLKPEELSEYVSRQLAPYKRPSQIILVPTMPVTLTGKVIKGELAKMLESHNPTP